MQEVTNNISDLKKGISGTLSDNQPCNGEKWGWQNVQNDQTLTLHLGFCYKLK